MLIIIILIVLNTYCYTEISYICKQLIKKEAAISYHSNDLHYYFFENLFFQTAKINNHIN